MNTLNPGPFLLHCVYSAATLYMRLLVTQDPGVSLLVFVWKLPPGQLHGQEGAGRRGVALCNCLVPRWSHNHPSSAFRRPGGIAPQWICGSGSPLGSTERVGRLRAGLQTQAIPSLFPGPCSFPGGDVAGWARAPTREENVEGQVMGI